MTNFYKYLPVSSEDESWGLYVFNAGCNRIKRNEIYPSAEHPAHHYFNWSKGRVLDEYQIIYISNGEGVFESADSGLQNINEGSIIFLFPGEWHRFKPNNETGWDEFWIGCKGSIIENLFAKKFLDTKNAVINIGVNDNITQLFISAIEQIKEEKTGYQQFVSGIVLHLLGAIHALNKQRNFKTEGNTETSINKARSILRTNIDENISMEEVAAELNVSYAWFRKAFKSYTGIAPNQYLLQLKIEKAKMLLANHSKSVKEIAFSLNFESASYFSKLFKEKTGISPEQFMKNMQR